MAEEKDTVTFRYVELDEEEPRQEAAQLVKDLLPAVTDRSRKSIPDAPENIYALQALRVAVEVHQTVILQGAIGSQGSARLEAFLVNEFTRGGEYWLPH